MPSEQSDAHSATSRALEVTLYMQPKQEDGQSDGCNTPGPQADSPRSEIDSLQDAAASKVDQTRWLLHESDHPASSPSPSPASDRFDDSEYSPPGRTASTREGTSLGEDSSSGSVVNGQVTGSAASANMHEAQSLRPLSGLFAERHPGQFWSAEQERAFVDYLAQDSVLLPWAKDKTVGGAMGGLKRFSELTQGPNCERLSAKVSLFRKTYLEFSRKLTPSGRSTRTSEWSQAHNAKDLSWLVSFEHRNAWVKNWHDKIHLDQFDESSAAGSESRAAESPTAAASASTSTHDAAQVADSSNSHSALAVQSKHKCVSKEGAAPHLALAASSAGVASSSSLVPAPKHDAPATQSQPTGIQARLEQQAQQIQLIQAQIQLLQGQSQQQTQLLVQQAAQSSQQATALGRVEQQLESLFAFVRERM